MELLLASLLVGVVAPVDGAELLPRVDEFSREEGFDMICFCYAFSPSATILPDLTASGSPGATRCSAAIEWR